jgi:hypothetical protein
MQEVKGNVAARVASAFNDQDPRMKRWACMSAERRRQYVLRWERRLQAIRDAGFEVVEAAEIERLRKAHKAACGGDELLRAAFTRLLDRLTRERDEARAEVARLLLGSEVLASHQGSLEREWHSGGAWLYAGDTINVVRAPLPEIEVVS